MILITLSNDLSLFFGPIYLTLSPDIYPLMIAPALLSTKKEVAADSQQLLPFD